MIQKQEQREGRIPVIDPNKVGAVTADLGLEASIRPQHESVDIDTLGREAGNLCTANIAQIISQD